ncbi:MAG: CmcJ/NvfI family oxidoreductase [Sandaracinaceae bacterium]
MASPRDRAGAFNYLAPSVRSSLYRNGEVLVHRDPDGNDSGAKGLDLVEHAMTVTDARALPERPTCERNGFELIRCPLARPDLDFFDHEAVARHYYPEVAEVVADAVGASYVVAFDHNVRSAQAKASKARLQGGQDVQAPIHLTHGDYTLRSAPERLEQLAKPPSGNDTLRSILPPGRSVLDPEPVQRAVAGDLRFAIINLWRSIAPEPIATHPLALCDARSVAPRDLVVFEVHYQDRIGENYFAKHADHHGWHYFPAMTRDEGLLLKQWDSAGTLARSRGARGDGDDPEGAGTFSLHSAFDDPTTPPDAPDRRSIEVRCAVLYA